MGPESVDPDLVRNTTGAILSTLDQIAQRFIANEAGKIGADAKSQAEYQKAVALSPGPRQLMVSTSPQVAEALGIDAKQYPVGAFLSGLGLWATSMLLAVSSINQAGQERARLQASRAAASAGNGAPSSTAAEARGIQQSDPARPAGAPPNVV